MSKSYRILITGSRDWDDADLIATESSLADEMIGHVEHFKIANPILVSGSCPNGADAMAEEAWRERGWPIEQHPAAWEKYGKRAGFVRNAEMVNSGADVCFAFIRNASNGATMTRKLAITSGITTHTYRQE